MGKATNPRAARQAANDELHSQGEVERINGVDHNRCASPLVYWRAHKQLTTTQEAGIAYCIRLWSILTSEPRVTAGYGERIGGHDGDETGRQLIARADAKDDLRRVQGYIPPAYWQVFENAIRFDEPAGVIGSRLGWGSNSAKTKALTIVQVVADTVCMQERLSV
jgi:hypothetical protein